MRLGSPCPLVAPAGSASARKDFIALFKVGEESLRKYDAYKVPRQGPVLGCARPAQRSSLIGFHRARVQVISKEGLPCGEVVPALQPATARLQRALSRAQSARLRTLHQRTPPHALEGP